MWGFLFRVRYNPAMRFRQKFPALQALSALLWIALVIAWSRENQPASRIGGASVISLVAWLFILLWSLAGYFFIWWDITSDGITERRLWNTRSIPWDEVCSVAPWRPRSKTIHDTVEVEYARTGPISDRGSLMLLPREHQSLLAALRARAPHATFDL